MTGGESFTYPWRRRALLRCSEFASKHDHDAEATPESMLCRSRS